MFTGIVEGTAEVLRQEAKTLENGEGVVLALRLSFAEELEMGESVAINGCCLTVEDLSKVKEGEVNFHLLGETLKRTNLGDLEVGSTVNVERSLRVGDRLSGHFVQGHVDAAVEVLTWEQEGGDGRLEIALPIEGSELLAEKGSVCLDGMSLTVAELGEKSLTIWITPHTAKVTRLNHLQVGDRVNLEFDMLARHLQRL